MDENRITGAAKELAGKAQGAVGDVVGDRETQAKGKANELQGSAENLYGQAKDVVGDIADKASGVAKDSLGKSGADTDELGRAYREGTETVTHYAKESPLALAAMAGALGYLLALVIHGRR